MCGSIAPGNQMSSTRDTVYAELRRRLMSGAFLPGQRLREEHLANELSVSRTPVRSAIQLLVADGLVGLEERRGAVVLGLTDRDINEAFQIRSLMEPYAASLAAQHATDEEIDALEAINEAMSAAVLAAHEDRAAQIQQLNNRFHHALLDAAHSARVSSLVSSLLDMPILIGSFYFYTAEDMMRSVEHHRQIIAALRARDAAFAETSTRFHLAATHLLFRNQRARG